MDDFVTILSSKIDELNLKAPVSGPCEGYILESRSTMAGKGRPATVLVKRGTLNKKDLLIAGETLCKGMAQNTIMLKVPNPRESFRIVPNKTFEPN